MQKPISKLLNIENFNSFKHIICTLYASLQFIQMTEAPEKFIISDDPAYEEGEQRHKAELADEADKWSDGLLEDGLDDLDVELGAHVDSVDDDHEDHDVHEQLVEGPV